MFAKKTLLVAALGCTAAFATTHVDAASIGWNYQGMGGVGLASTDSSGAPSYAQTNWNNHAGAGQAPGATPLNDLVNDSGVATDVDVTSWTQTANTSWRYGETANPDQILLNDAASTDPEIVFSNVNDFTADGYTVVVYYGSNEWDVNGGGTLTVNGNAQTIASNDAFSVTGYVLNDGSNQSNYAVYTGVSGDTLTVTMDAVGNDSISAIQIVEVPEPGSLALLGLGGLMIVRRRRG